MDEICVRKGELRTTRACDSEILERALRWGTRHNAQRVWGICGWLGEAVQVTKLRRRSPEKTLRRPPCKPKIALRQPLGVASSAAAAAAPPPPRDRQRIFELRIPGHTHRTKCFLQRSIEACLQV